MTDYTKLFKEVHDQVIASFHPGGSMEDSVIKLDERRISVCERANEKRVYAALIGDKTFTRVEATSREPTYGRRYYKILNPRRLATTLMNAAVAGRSHSLRRREEISEGRRTVAIARRLLEEAGIVTASSMEPMDNDGVPRLWVDPGPRGQVMLMRSTSYKIFCWPERAVEAARPLLALFEALEAFNAAVTTFKNEPPPEGT